MAKKKPLGIPTDPRIPQTSNRIASNVKVPKTKGTSKKG